MACRRRDQKPRCVGVFESGSTGSTTARRKSRASIALGTGPRQCLGRDDEGGEAAERVNGADVCPLCGWRPCWRVSYQQGCPPAIIINITVKDRLVFGSCAAYVALFFAPPPS